jgi:predicted ATPase
LFDKDLVSGRTKEDYYPEFDGEELIGISAKYIIPIELNAAKYFLGAMIQESLINSPSFISEITFIEAVRANIQRVYSFQNQGTEFNEIAKNYLETINSPAVSRKKTNNKFGNFTKKWIEKFEIGNDIKFKTTDDGSGLQIYLIKGTEESLLADEGYGITQLLSILLSIELKTFNKAFKYSHPFLRESQMAYRESTIAIEEPETNLHPKYQSLLAEMFMDAYKTYNVRFIIETHSEYLIRKLQTLVAKKELTTVDVALHYIYHHDEAKRPDGKPQVLNIKIKEDGRLSEPFGAGFYDESTKLMMDLITGVNSN